MNLSHPDFDSPEWIAYFKILPQRKLQGLSDFNKFYQTGKLVESQTSPKNGRKKKKTLQSLPILFYEDSYTSGAGQGGTGMEPGPCPHMCPTCQDPAIPGVPRGRSGVSYANLRLVIKLILTPNKDIWWLPGQSHESGCEIFHKTLPNQF